MALERPGQRAEQIAGQIFSYGRVVPIEETTAKLDQIDAAAVRRFGERILQGADPSIAAVGPISQLEKHSVFARRFGSERSARAAISPAPRPRHSADDEPVAAAELAKAE